MIWLYVIAPVLMLLFFLIVKIFGHYKRQAYESELKTFEDLLSLELFSKIEFEIINSKLDYFLRNRNRFFISSAQKQKLNEMINSLYTFVQTNKNIQQTIPRIVEFLKKYYIYFRLSEMDNCLNSVVEMLENNISLVSVEHAPLIQKLIEYDCKIPVRYYEIASQNTEEKRNTGWFRSWHIMREEDGNNIIRSMPDITSCDHLEQLEYIVNSTAWTAIRQRVLDFLIESFSFKFFQKIFAASDNEINTYYENNAVKFAENLKKSLDSSRSKVYQRIHAGFNKYFVDKNNFPCWLYGVIKQLMSLPEYASGIFKEYLGWAEIFMLDLSNKTLVVQRTIDIFPIVKTNNIRVEQYKYYLFYYLTHAFSEHIVPFLNDPKTSYNLSEFYTILELVPEDYRGDFSLFFSSIDPSHERYPYSWTIYLKSKLRKKNILSCLDIFVNECGLWNELKSLTSSNSLQSIKKCFQHINFLRKRFEKENLIAGFIKKLKENLNNPEAPIMQELRDNPDMPVLRNLQDGFITIVKIGAEYATTIDRTPAAPAASEDRRIQSPAARS